MAFAPQEMSLPPERVAELRQVIHSQVAEMGVLQQIQRCLADSGDQYASYMYMYIIQSTSML